MAHGAPDFYNSQAKGNTYTLSDMAELAARLGAAHNFDRLGDLIYGNTFSNGINGLNIIGGGTGNHVEVDGQAGIFGPLCAHLISDVGEGNYSGLRAVLPFTGSARLGAEASFSFVVDNGTFYIYIRRYRDNVEKQGSIRLTRQTKTLEYRDNTGWHTLDTYPAVFGGYFDYNRLKVVVDFDKVEYVRIRYNDRTYNMQGIPLYTTSASSDSMIFGEVRAENCYHATLGIRVGHIILTQNEP
jgi:hypothetical protein